MHAIAAVFVGLALLTIAAGAGAAETIKYTKESLGEYEKQLAAGQVQAAIFNRKVRSIRVTLKDGRHVLARYDKHGFKTQEAKLQAKRVHMTVLSQSEANKELKEKPKHHKIRYIVAGVVIVVILIVGAVLLVNRRRRRD